MKEAVSTKNGMDNQSKDLSSSNFPSLNNNTVEKISSGLSQNIQNSIQTPQ
jgi:hypothetical protein